MEESYDSAIHASPVVFAYFARRWKRRANHYQGIGNTLLSLKEDKITIVEVAATSSISLIFSSINF